jgi:hypothetical protein
MKLLKRFGLIFRCLIFVYLLLNVKLAFCENNSKTYSNDYSTYSNDYSKKDKIKNRLTYGLELNFNLKNQTFNYRQYLSYKINEKYAIRLILRQLPKASDFDDSELDFRIYYKINDNSTIYIGESNEYFSFNYTYKFSTSYPISLEATLIKRENFIQINSAFKIELTDNFHVKYGINNITRSPEPFVRPSVLFRL